tara:strand:- start:5899 stop:6795 length:897 start_codon:yes stop_codon:yes gene_type:complete
MEAPLPIDLMNQEFEALKRATNDLKRRIQEAQEGSYFHRADDRAMAMRRRLFTARGHIELALETLRDVESQDTDVASKTAEGSWLAGKLRGLTDSLLGKSPNTPAESTMSQGAFEGDTGAVSIPDLLGFLQVQGKTGILIVQADDENITIEIEGGRLVHAFSTNTPDETKLGEILVRQGAITRDRLASVFQCMGRSRSLLGEALISGNVVNELALTRALNEQVQSLFHRLMALRHATFHFSQGLGRQSDGRRGMNLTQLLLESARHIDESGNPVPDAALNFDVIGEDASFGGDDSEAA